MKKKGLPQGLIIGSCSILETAGQGALVPLYQTLQSAITPKDSESSSSNPNKIVWVSCLYDHYVLCQSLLSKSYYVNV